MRFGKNGQIEDPYQTITFYRFAKAEFIFLQGVTTCTIWHVENIPRLTCSLLNVEQTIAAQMRCLLICICRVLLE